MRFIGLQGLGADDSGFNWEAASSTASIGLSTIRDIFSSNKSAPGSVNVTYAPSPMSTGAKVAIGVGFVGIVGIGVYLLTKK
jgi:hypothetical protein